MTDRNLTTPQRDPLDENDYSKCEAAILKLAEAISQSKAPPPDEKVALRADYQITVDIVKLLTDIRFRCLAFVTAVIAVANALVPGTADPGTRTTLGLVGFLATLGIAVYELRNSQLYEAAIHRAKVLESFMEVRRTSAESDKGGLFNERPPYTNSVYWKSMTVEERRRAISDKTVPFLSFWFVTVSHDRGLALIYGAALGGWIYLITEGLLAIPLAAYHPAPWLGPRRTVAMLFGVIGFLLSAAWFQYHDKKRFRPAAPEA